MVKYYSKLFIDPNIDYPMDNGSSFEKYIQQCRALIENTRLDLDTHAELIVDANTPYEYRSTSSQEKKHGALLIHGLLDSPFTMRDIGTELQAEGLLVRSVLLPGHGTIPGALLNTDYTQWTETVRSAAHSLSKEVERIYLVGYSTGGMLALYHALKNPEKIAGLILIAPAFKINCLFDFVANWPPKFRKPWFHIDKQETLDYSKYRSTAFNAAYQVYRIADEVKKMPAPNCPLFFTLSASDVTVLSHVSINYFLAHNNPNNRMILYSNKPNTQYNDDRITIRSSVYPEKNIVNFSHITIPLAPHNPHYGENGDYAEASHINNNHDTLYGEHHLPLMHFHNWLFKQKLTKYKYQRLSFNPDFAFLSEQIKRFISNII